VFEETGIEDYIKITNLDYSFEFHVESSNRNMIDYCYAMEVLKASNIKLSVEHSECKWCSYTEAMNLLKYDENKTVLQMIKNEFVGDKKYKHMRVNLKYIAPHQHYLSKDKYESVEKSDISLDSYGDIYVIEYKDKLFSVDGHHRLYWLYNHNVDYVDVICELSDNECI
jgi:hypothetical protein